MFALAAAGWSGAGRTRHADDGTPYPPVSPRIVVGAGEALHQEARCNTVSDNDGRRLTGVLILRGPNKMI